MGVKLQYFEKLKTKTASSVFLCIPPLPTNLLDSCLMILRICFFFFQIEEIDLLPQFLYMDYKWLIDFSLCATVINVLVEIFAYSLPNIYTQELNLGLVWNFLVIFFAMYPLLGMLEHVIVNYRYHCFLLVWVGVIFVEHKTKFEKLFCIS